ncbi:immunity 22 family protein [Paenibacillus spongiae]|uniref:Immunity 22 family protein n=1 Tax=Paenibacillus spongiae TaxID=2909671 RepID=A0ABY5S1J2_9BACL|nr:immunity 22 family protein [Paenibacillus spongiae]UVI27744.1 immunity 22 family protein [Paenibacillus spongiae]
MKNIVMIWGANFASEEELYAYVESRYDDDGDVLPSGFMASIGGSWIDDDFLEAHFLVDDVERGEFTVYLHEEYSPHELFAEQLPNAFEASIRAYNSIILLYGNDSPYGAVNEVLFAIEAVGREGSAAVLLASIEYETEDR